MMMSGGFFSAAMLFTRTSFLSKFSFGTPASASLYDDIYQHHRRTEGWPLGPGSSFGNGGGQTRHGNGIACLQRLQRSTLKLDARKL
jgi:hypothetical protein